MEIPVSYKLLLILCNHYFIIGDIMGLTHQIANNEEEALHLLFEGETNRSIAEHQMNKSSTRSHCIFTLHLDIR